MHRLALPLRLLAAGIALIAGYVDAVGFVGYGGMFVSFMSGNSTRIGAHAALEWWAAAGLTGGVIGSFVVGVAVGQACGGREDAVRRARVAWLVAAALAVAAALPNLVDAYVALLAAAFAMGAVNTVFAESPLPVGLTYMTGPLVKFGQSLGLRLRGEAAPPMTPYLVHWLALASGAALGAAAFAVWRFAALWVAAGAAAAFALAPTSRAQRRGGAGT